MLNKNTKSGFGLIEIVVATALISSSLFALSAISQLALRASDGSLMAIKGSYLAEEAFEAARSVRDDGWTANISVLVLEQPYYPVFSSSKWSLSPTSPGMTDGLFERRVIFSEVWRKTADDNIVASTSPDNKYLDQNTLEVSIFVSWPKTGGVTSSVELVNYLTNLFED